MGSGSFGGGSGSFGGGSGGGSGGGGGSGRGGGRGGGGGGGSSGTDSAHDRILKLTKLTESVNANPEIAKVRATIYRLLQDRTRSAFLRVTLSDAIVACAYGALLSLEADLRGATVAKAASKLGNSAGATLADLADVICQRGQAADTDERTESIVRRAVADLLLRTVGNRHDLYYDTPVENLGSKFAAAPLQNTADIFLGNLICEAVRRDLLNLSAESRAVIADASHEIAVSWTDKFKDRSRKKGVSFRDMMQTIGEDYPYYSGSQDE